MDDVLSDRVVWEDRPRSKYLFYRSILRLLGDIAFVVIGVIILYLNIFGKFDVVSFIEGCGSLLTGSYHFYAKTRAYLKASSLQYSATVDAIVIEWTIFKKTQVRIPFQEVTKISQVAKEGKAESTIYIDTTDVIKYRGVDLESGEPRQTVTLEMIHDGAEVTRMLDKLRIAAQQKDGIANNTRLRLQSRVETAFFPERWGYFVVVLFASMFLQGLIFLVDFYALPSKWHEDVVISSEKIYDQSGALQGVKKKTQGKRRFSYHATYNSKIDQIELHLTRIFRTVKEVKFEGEDTVVEMRRDLNGYGWAVYALTLCMLAASCSYLIHQKFLIELDEALFFVGGPILFYLFSVFLLFWY